MGDVRLLGTTRGAIRLGLVIALLLLVLGASGASAATLFGTVSSEAPGQAVLPAAGASVTVLDPQSGTTVGLAMAGLDGSYSLAIPSGTYDVRFDPPPEGGFASATVGDVEVATSRKLDIVLIPAGTSRLSGVLRDASGMPVAGAEVYMGNEATASAVTGSDGSYSMVVAPGRYSLFGEGSAVSRAGLPPRWGFGAGTVDLTGGDRVVDLTLPAVVSYTVRVAGSDGAPLPGTGLDVANFSGSADVGLGPGGYVGSWGEGPSGGYQATTDAAGEARFAVFDGTGAPTAMVTPPDGSGYGQQTIVPQVADGDTTFEVRLSRGVQLSGVLRDASGTPVAGAEVYAGNEAVARAVTGLDGSYSMLVAPGRYPLFGESNSAVDPGLPANWTFGAGTVDLTGGDRVVDLTLPAVVSYTVRVVGSDEAPIPGAGLDLANFSGSADVGLGPDGYVGSWEAGPSGGYHATTDAAGEARFTVFDGTAAPSGDLTPPDGSGYGPETIAPSVANGNTTFEVRLSRGVQLSGVLRDGSGMPVAGAVVYVGNEAVARAVTGLDGSYSMVVAPGRYPLFGESNSVVDPGLPPNWEFGAGTVDLTGGDRVVDLTLPAAVSYTVRVLGSDGAPVPGVALDFGNFSGAADVGLGVGGYAASWGAGPSGGYQATTDANGEATFVVLDGTAAPSGDLTPPDGSGYAQETIVPQAADGDTTVVVRFTASTPPDIVSPTIACDPAPTGWHADEVSVACTASDGGSGLADPADASFSLSTAVGDGNEDAAAQTGTHQVCDRAGNCATAGPIGPITVDRSAPSIAFSQQPDGGSGWWRSSPATVHVVASDLTIASLACTVDGVSQTLLPTAASSSLEVDVTVSGEGRHTVSCTAGDVVGHSSVKDEPVLIDQTAPSAPGFAADRGPDYAGRGGWYRDTVTVSVAGNGDPALADGSPGSGVDPASIPAPQTLATSGNDAVSASVADLAGNVSAIASAVFRVDAEPPMTTLTCPAAAVAVRARASARWKDRDGESGLATVANGTIALDTSAAGTYSVQHTATDDVGHSATSTCSYRVA